MIIKGKVRPSIMESPIDKDILQFIREYQPKYFEVSDDEAKQTEIKTLYAEGVIVGEMSKLVRNNENVLSRDCAILDLDDVVVTEEELLTMVADELTKLDYILYPSISYGLKGVRYRLMIPLDRPVNEQEYRTLLEFFFKETLSKIVRNVDQSNFTWSQIQLLPALTQFVKQEQIIINKGEQRIPVDTVLLFMKKKKPASKKKAPVNQFKKGGSRYRNTTTELFESLVSGCEIGNRNNRLASITGGLLARAVDVAAVLELVKIANQYFTEPLSDKEVETTFYSIARSELKAK